MGAAMEAFQGLFNLSQCSRRKRTRTPESLKFDFAEGIKASAASPADSDSTFSSTEPGDLSHGDFSDRTSGSSDISDNENHAPGLPIGLPPGLTLSAPPGLGFCPNTTMPQAPHRTRLGTRLNSQAALFVPTGAMPAPVAAEGFGAPPDNARQLCNSIRLLKDVLEDWETTVPSAAQDHHALNQQRTNAHAIGALQEALTRLSPHDAAAVRTYLNEKEAKRNATLTVDSLVKSARMAMMGTTLDKSPGIAGHSLEDLLFPADAPAQAPAPGPIMPSAPGLYPPAPGPMMPPPGTFCCPQPPLMGMPASAEWMPPVAMSPVTVAQPHSYTPLGVVRPDPQQSTAEARIEEFGETDDSKETLRTNLRDLSEIDPARVVMVRKINRLGLESPGLLEAYFSKFGHVERVMVSHSRAKSIFGRPAARLRPAGLGFLVMGCSEHAEAILEAGAEHEIQGASVCASRFESRSIDGERDY